VITGFGRLGAVFAAERYGVTPDLLCFAKGVTSGAVPMGGVIAREPIYDAFMRGPEHTIELFHGYTYSAHPLACAAGIATLDLYRDEDIFGRARRLEKRFGDAAMTLKELPGVLDIRAVGIAAGIDLAPRAGAPGERGYEAMDRAFHDEDLVIRITGDTLAIAPPLIVTEAQIAEIFEKVGRVIRAVMS
jgi:beta-alanine--pyruvate transaminase